MDQHNKSKITIGSLPLGEGMPKICIPFMGKDEDEVVANAASILTYPGDLAEWRADHLSETYGMPRVVQTILPRLRSVLGDMPLLFTFRSKEEGGERQLSKEEYLAWNREALQTGCVDFIDVELMAGDLLVKTLIQEAHKLGVYVIVSNHDFHETPQEAVLVNRLEKMIRLGADLPKLAVMPAGPRDVLTLLSATEEIARRHPGMPLITMSMSGAGLVSRICGESFGSAVTFGSAGRASAPGQIPADALKEILQILHENR